MRQGLTLLLVIENRVYIDGYETVRRDRATNGSFGGGICFYIRNCINFSVRNDLSLDQLGNLCILKGYGNIFLFWPIHETF